MTDLNQNSSECSYISDKAASVILVAIITLSALLGIYRLGKESLWFDEVTTVNYANNSIFGIINNIVGDINAPFYFLVMHYWTKFGSGEFYIRSLSVIFTIGSTYMTYKLGKLLFNKEIGLLGAFFLSISLPYITYSQEARPYALMVLLVLLSNYYFMKILKDDDKKSEILYVVGTSISIYTNYYGFFYLISQNIYYFFYHFLNGKKIERRMVTTKTWIIIQICVLLSFVPWVLSLMAQAKRTIGGGTDIWPPTLYDTFKYIAGSDYELYLFIIIGAISIILYVDSLPLSSREKKELYYITFLSIWLAFPILSSVEISKYFIPILRTRYILMSLPPFMLLTSKFVLDLRKNILIVPLIIILVIYNIQPIVDYYQQPQKERWQEVTQYIKDNKLSNEAVLFFPKERQVAFQYYYNYKNFYPIDKVDDIDKNLSDNYDGIWLVYSGVYSTKKQESDNIENTLSKNFTKIDSKIFSAKNLFQDIEVIHYIKNKL